MSVHIGRWEDEVRKTSENEERSVGVLARVCACKGRLGHGRTDPCELAHVTAPAPHPVSRILGDRKSQDVRELHTTHIRALFGELCNKVGVQIYTTAGCWD